jgi:hypothetical protein
VKRTRNISLQDPEIFYKLVQIVIYLIRVNKKKEMVRCTDIFLDIMHRLVFSKPRPIYFSKQRFGDCILSPSSGITYLVGPNR